MDNNKLNSFAELDLQPLLIKGLAELGFTKTTTIQAQAIPVVLMGTDLLANAPTGTGKTLAFVVPVIDHLLNFPKNLNLRSLIVSPTRDLALQTFQVIEQLNQQLPPTKQLKIGLLTGAEVQEQQQQLLEQRLDILVATPGRLANYFREAKIDASHVEILVFDEGDRLIQMGFGEDAYLISDNCENRINTLIFSATLDSPELYKFAADVMEDPVHLSPNLSRSEKAKINQYYYHADNVDHKKKILVRYISENHIKKCLVFVRKREQVRALSDYLRARSIRATYLEGNMGQSQRTRALTYLEDGTVNVLVATDLAARGLDIDDIDLVVNYDLPYNGDTYVHRIGRTGRNKKKGLAISLVENHDYLSLGKAMRYQGEFFKARVMEGLEPKTSANTAAIAGKTRTKKPTKTTTSPPAAKAKVKNRQRNLKNKGKPKNKHDKVVAPK